MFGEGLLADKVVLVTGASRGIGHGIALTLGRAGAVVVGTATTQEGADRITLAFQNEGLNGAGMVLNVTSPDSINALMAAIKSHYGAVNILVNNAAVTQDNLFLRMKDDEWFQVIDTNLNSIYRLSKACIKDMLKARWGRIINIGSVVGSMGNPGQANYAAAKAGVVGFSKALALEVGSRDITVNTVSPGFIATDMTNALSDEQREAIFQRIPMQRMGSIEDIAAAVLFLASKAAGYITGQTLHVNGGMYMN
ncbi:3-oxoacyl-ACP reductase FabG [Aquicella lusitana]|uniref:3-oxoacyl-[acyl-carrier-protein] reductase n=1 Tax=Aquicella lusitana TaxID=254246 RepID=A0A370GQM0_9COXI|nr:3-oxoacyl-ACP reductase FabG [Aquicella lusitana]RDI46012.1 3-oxoacyl-[acyl-carrier-protein] reductase [Aquicella lusitana]VVC73391.1 3-oxoacyl-[acyl-carrier-protein] reductase FabG [Aquicella lusitana]